MRSAEREPYKVRLVGNGKEGMSEKLNYMVQRDENDKKQSLSQMRKLMCIWKISVFLSAQKPSLLEIML